MSSIIPEQCNFIIVGAWNPAIIQPAWFKKQFPNLIKEDQFGIELVTAPFPSFRYNVNNVLISPNSDRLIFVPKEIKEEILTFISELSGSILKNLPHTPVLAAGCNFVYTLDDKECFYISEFELTEKLSDFYAGIELKEFTSKQIRHGFSFSDYNLNISYNFTGDSRTIHYNFDYQLKDINLIKKASESLNDHYKYSLDLNTKLIRGK